MEEVMSELISLDEIASRKRTLFEQVWYPIERFFRDLPYNLRRIKWFFQRGRRGWADCDTWSIMDYLSRITPEMLRHMQENAHGYPGYGKARTFGRWIDLLEEMIEGWEAAQRVCEDDYVDRVQPRWFEKGEKLTKKTLNKTMRMSKRDQKLFEAKMKIFVEWFFHLWD
jgi:hypothetical protein